jgi:undecaprenyl-diphosphatase
MDFITRIDTSLFLFFNQFHSDGADILFYFISHRFFWIPLYLAVMGGMIYKYKKKAVSILFFLVLAVFATDQTCNLLKNSVQRLRPSHNTELVAQIHLIDYPDGKLYRGGKFGFPSSHAANSIVFAFFVIFFLSEKRKWFIIAVASWAVLIGYSRIYLGIHYPGDLLGGYIFGAFFAFLFGKLLPEWINRCKVRMKKS